MSQSRERQFSANSRRNNRNSSRSRSGSRASTMGDRIRCFKCREYNHFPKDCPNISEIIKHQTEQLQQMLGSKEHETALKFLAKTLTKF